MKDNYKNIKNKTKHHESDVDIDAVWAAIEPEVDKINADRQRKKRGGYWWLWGAVLLLGGTFYYLNNNLYTDTDAKIIDPATAEILPRENQTTDATETVDSGLAVREGQSGSNTDIISTADNNDRQTVSFPVPNRPDRVFNASEKNGSSSDKSDLPALRSNKKAVAEKPINPEVKSAAASSLPSVTKITDDYLIADPASESGTENSPNPTTDNPDKNAPLAVQNQEEKDPTDTQTIKKEIIPPTETPAQPPVPAEEEDRRQPKYSNFALGAYAGYSIISRDLSSTVDSLPAPEVLNLRRESEKLLEAQSYGLNAAFTHRSGFSLSVGGQYTLLTERYDNNKTEMRIDSTEGVVQRIVDLNGDTTDIIGMIPQKTTITFEKQIYNRYRLLDIPVLIGYEGGRDAWKFGVQAGVIANLSLTTSGQVRNSRTEDLDIGARQNEIFKDKAGLSYYFGGVIRYEILENTELSLAPNVRIFSQSFTVDDYILRQKYTLLGLQLGLRYRIE